MIRQLQRVLAEITPFVEKLRRNLDLNILQSVKNTNQFGMVDKVAGLVALPREFELMRGSRSKYDVVPDGGTLSRWHGETAVPWTTNF